MASITVCSIFPVGAQVRTALVPGLGLDVISLPVEFESKDIERLSLKYTIPPVK